MSNSLNATSSPARPAAQPHRAVGEAETEENDGNLPRVEIEPAAPQSIVAILTTGSIVGAGLYDVETGVLMGVPDQVDFDDYRVSRKIITQLSPTRVVVMPTAPRKFLTMLKAAGVGVREEGGEAEEEGATCEMSTLSLKEWDFKLCLSRLLTLPLFNQDRGDTSKEDRLMLLDAKLSLDNKLMIRCLGAVLGFLLKHRVGGVVLDADAGVFVADLRLRRLDDVLLLDHNTLDALRVFKRVGHPASSLKSGVVKDFECLFTLANTCKSKPGSSCLRYWFLQPSTDPAVIRPRLDAVAFFLAYFTSACDARVKELSRLLSRVGFVARVFTKIATAPATHRDFLLLSRTIVAANHVTRLLGDALEAIVGRSRRGSDVEAASGLAPIVARLRAANSPSVIQVAEAMLKALDLEAMETQKKILVREGVEPSLDRRKRDLTRWPEYLSIQAKRQMDQLPGFVSSCTLVYLNQIGFLVQIPMDDSSGKETRLKAAGAEIVFSHDDMTYLKTPLTSHIDKEYDDLLETIASMEREILRRLQRLVVAEAGPVSRLVDAVAEVDALLALANFAHRCNLNKPEIVEPFSDDSHSIVMQDSRHILQEAFVEETYIANDFFSGGDANKIKILTGPNASGKSVYLCQVALVVYLAQVGSFVPATRARLSIVDRIFTRINSEESVSACTSSWGCDLGQVAEMINEATPTSLVLLDEFGKGTDAVSGSSLLAAVVNRWSRRDNGASPHIIVATHFHELTRLTEDGTVGLYLANVERITFLTMSFVSEDSGHEDSAAAPPAAVDAPTKPGTRLTFLYRVVEGCHRFSHALQIAESIPLGDAIIARAREALTAITDPDGGEDFLPLESESEKKKRMKDQRILEEIANRVIDEKAVEDLRKIVAELDKL